MDTKSKNTLKAAALGAGLVAVLLPTGCASSCGPGGACHGSPPSPGSANTVVAPTHTVD